MKAKKLIALVTALTMVVLPTSTVFADQTDLTGVTTTSEATINYLDPSTFIRMVVPTSAGLEFTLDPQNLAATLGVGEWDPTAGGTILPQTVVQVVNKSAVPVNTQVDFAITDGATTATVLVTDPASINTGTDRKMYLTLTPANAVTSLSCAAIAATTAPSYFQDGGSAKEYTAAELTAAGIISSNLIAQSASGSALFAQFVALDDAASPKTYNQVEVPAHTDVANTAPTTIATYNATTGGLADADDAVAVTSTSGAALYFAINKAEYYVSNTTADGYALTYRELDVNDNYDTASFIIGGQINMNADWSVYTGPTTISLGAVYTFTKMSTAEYGATTILTGSHNSYAYIEPVAPSIATTAYTMALTTAVPVTVDLGAGSADANGIASVMDGSTTVDASNYTFADPTLTLKSSYIDTLIGDGTADVTKTLTVTFDDTDATAVVLTLTYTAPVTPVDPSIGTTAYTMTASTGVDVTVDLGAGTSVATGVDTVKDGVTTVDSSNYTFNGTDTLSFTSAYINTLIGAGTANASKTLTVTFDNTDATAVDITLTYTAPVVAASVTPTDVTFSKVSGATVAVNLGSGTGLATSITAVAVTAAGTDYPFTVGTYSLSGTTLTLTNTVSIASLATGQTRVIKVTFNTGATDTFNVTIAN